MTYYRSENDRPRSINKDYAIECIKLTYKHMTTEEITAHLEKGGFYQTKYATYYLTND